MNWGLLLVLALWFLLLLGVTPTGTPVVVEQPEEMKVENWDSWDECFTDPGWPIWSCEQAVTVEWSTQHTTETRMGEWWCMIHDYSYHDPPHRNISPYCLSFDYDHDGDIDMADYAIWQPWNPELEVLSFCRYDNCWTVFFLEVNGVWEAGLVKHPTLED